MLPKYKKGYNQLILTSQCCQIKENYIYLRKDLRIFIPQWDKYGKKAGYLRNVEMAENANALIAFWDGKSKGTKHMIDIATERNLPIRVIRY